MNKYSTLYITALGLISCTGGNKSAEASATAAVDCDANKHLINR